MSAWDSVRLKRSECPVLSLVLKGRWFDKIASGEKREEYRAWTRYWIVRLHNWDRRGRDLGRAVVEFRRGYARNAARMAFWVVGIPWRMRCYDLRGCIPLHPEWGEPESPHFVIRLGGRVEIESEAAK